MTCDRLLAGVAAVMVIGLVPPVAQAAEDPPVAFTKGPLAAPDPTANVAMQQREYHIGPADTLEISVFNVERLSRTLTVDDKGEIDFPLIGTVRASTRTSAELANEIANRLGEKYLQAPQVTVFVKQSANQKFTVEGAVNAPGNYDMQGRMTLIQAIAAADGVQDSAILSQVTIFRTVHDKPMATVVDLKQVRKGKMTDPEIFPADKIVVANSATLHALHEMVALTPLVLLARP